MLYPLNQFQIMIKITATIRCFKKSIRLNQFKNNHNFFFNSITILRFGQIKREKEKFYLL